MSTYIFMLERKEHFEFSVYTLARDKTLKDIWKFLYSNSLSISWIRDSPVNKQIALDGHGARIRIKAAILYIVYHALMTKEYK